jgi:Tfp pilus assembly protein FimT
VANTEEKKSHSLRGEIIMIRNITHPAKGLTAIELLITVGIVAVVVVFASPILSSMIWKSELDQAIEITESSVKQARETARFYAVDVMLQLQTDENREQQSITLSIPAMRKDAVLNEVKEEFVLPVGIQIISDERTVHFDSAGEVEWPAHVTIVSNQAKGKTREFVIE